LRLRQSWQESAVRRRLPDEEPVKYAVARKLGGGSGVLMVVLEAALNRATGAGDDGRLRAWGGCVDAVEFAGAYAGPSRGGTGDASSVLLLLSGEVGLISVAMDLVEEVDSTTSVPLFILFSSPRAFSSCLFYGGYVSLLLLLLFENNSKKEESGGGESVRLSSSGKYLGRKIQRPRLAKPNRIERRAEGGLPYVRLGGGEREGLQVIENHAILVFR